MNVCIPWRDSGDPDRKDAFRRVTDAYASLDLPLIVSDSDREQPFNVSQARNRAAAQAPPGMLVFADADTLARPDVLLRMVDAAWETGGLVLPSHKWWQDARGAPGAHEEPLLAPLGGVMTIGHQAFAQVGGFDERFTGWSGEDSAFVRACQTLVGLHRVEADILHLWHPRPAPGSGDWAPRPEDLHDLADDDPGLERGRFVYSHSPLEARYLQAIDQPDQMLALLSEPGGPLGPDVSRTGARS